MSRKGSVDTLSLGAEREAQRGGCCERRGDVDVWRDGMGSRTQALVCSGVWAGPCHRGTAGVVRPVSRGLFVGRKNRGESAHFRVSVFPWFPMMCGIYGAGFLSLQSNRFRTRRRLPRPVYAFTSVLLFTIAPYPIE